MPQEVIEESMKTEIKRLKLKKLSNTRDMGGMKTGGGQIATEREILYR